MCALVTGVQTCALPICRFSRIEATVGRVLAGEAPHLENSAINVSHGRHFRPLTMSMTGRWRLYSSGPSHFAAVLGCKAALSYSSPSVDGEGDRAKRGGGEEARPPNFPSTMLRMEIGRAHV